MIFSRLFSIADADPPGKRFWQNGDGKLLSVTNGTRIKFRVEKIDTDLAGLAQILRTGLANEHLTSGVSEHADATAITVKELAKALEQGRQKCEHGRPLITFSDQDLQHRAGPGMMCIDTDQLGEITVIDQLEQAVPGIKQYARVQATSSSSNIFAGDKELRGVRSGHTFFNVADATDLPRAITTLHQRLVLVGLMTPKLSADGSFLERSIVDIQLRVPSQPIFVRSHLGNGLRQDKHVSLIDGIEVMDTQAVIQPLTGTEKDRLAKIIAEKRRELLPESTATRKRYVRRRVDDLIAKTGVGRKAAVSTVCRSLEGGVLGPDFQILLPDGSTVTVAEILRDPDRWHETPCRDPMEPDYGSPTVAKIFTNRSPIINSMAHGGRIYRLSQEPPEPVNELDAFVENLEQEEAERLTTEEGDDELAKWLDADTEEADERAVLALSQQYLGLVVDPPYKSKTVLSSGQYGGVLGLRYINDDKVHAPLLSLDQARLFMDGWHEADEAACLHGWAQFIASHVAVSTSDGVFHALAKHCAKAFSIPVKEIREKLEAAIGDRDQKVSDLRVRAKPRLRHDDEENPGEFDREELKHLEHLRQQKKTGGMPAGFRRTKWGIEYSIETDMGIEWHWLCSPIRVVSEPSSPAEQDWGYLVEITNPKGNTQRWAIPAELFAGDGQPVRAGCMALGLKLSTTSQAKAKFSELIQNWRPGRFALSSNRLGWTDETFTTFIFGDGSAVGDQDVVYQHPIMAVSVDTMRPVGSLNDWRDHVAALAVGNAICLLSISTAFAGPLLGPLAHDCGGFHLRGPSSRGKTKAFLMAASVWGSPGFMRRWRATSNGLEGTATACNSTALILDEIGEISAREAGQTIYMLGNGTGKQRADRLGRPREAYTWRLLYLSSGEISLADKVAEAGEKTRAGQDIRLLDIPIRDGEHGAFQNIHGCSNSGVFADKISRVSATYYGTAGREFVQRIVADYDRVTTSVRQKIDEYASAWATDLHLGSNVDGQIRRALTRFALVAAAGELATEFGITGWPSGIAKDAVFSMCQLWLNERGGTAAHEKLEAVERMRDALLHYGDARFIDLDRAAEEEAEAATTDSYGNKRTRMRQVVHDRWGWRDKEWFYVHPSAFRKIMEGLDVSEAARTLDQYGWITRSQTDRLTYRMGGGERATVYRISADIIGSEKGNNIRTQGATNAGRRPV